MLRFLQNYPAFLEWLYDTLISLIAPFRRWLRPGTALDRLMIRGEEIGKGAVFDCRMCGQCILHSTGMTCSRSCPKNLRNGPCGGVREHGYCEVKPEMRCVWVMAYERSSQMPAYGHELIQIQPPVNRSLQGTSSWVNMLHGIDTVNPRGWSIRAEQLPVMAGE